LLGLIKPRVLLALGCGAILAVSMSGFAAANTVPASKAGDGAGAITGYTIANVKYNLNATDPRNIDSVTFTGGPSAGTHTVKIKLVSTGSTWYSCTIAATNSCNTTSPPADVASANELRVVAADN
jgi:hypothetical protein